MSKAAFSRALKRMGYRRPDAAIKPDRWVKPFGYCVIIADVDHMRIQSFFRGPNNGTLHCWNHVNVEAETENNQFELQIATFEQYDGCEAGNDPTQFAFLTKEEQITEFGESMSL